MNGKELFQAGKLQEAIMAVTAEVRQNPGDASRRGLLSELLCLAGELERADKQLDALGHQDPDSMLGITLFRQLIRAEQSRGEFFQAGRLPDFLEKPGLAQPLYLEASIRIREGKPGEAVELLEKAEEQRPKPTGSSGTQPFSDFRDLDDLTAAFFEVLTSTGKYYWVPMAKVELIEFRPPQRPRDLLWRRAHMIVRDGPDGEVYMPVMYPNSHSSPNDQIRLGRATDWTGGPGEPIRGVGQRTFLVGDDSRGIMELEELQFVLE